MHRPSRGVNSITTTEIQLLCFLTGVKLDQRISALFTKHFVDGLINPLTAISAYYGWAVNVYLTFRVRVGSGIFLEFASGPESLRYSDTQKFIIIGYSNIKIQKST